MLNIVICEDDKIWLHSLTKIIQNIIEKNNLEAQIVLKSTNIEKVREFLKNNSANVFFLDIDFNAEKSGYALASEIRQSNVSAYIIFITAYLEYLMLAFKVQAFDFLPKPVTSEILEATLMNISENYINHKHLSSQPHKLNIKMGTSISSINTSDIVLIEKVASKTVIHLVNNDQKACRHPLEYLESKLPSNHYIRCHRAFIVNKKFIEEINTKENLIFLETGFSCPIGGKYKKNLLKHYSYI
ncbi:LytTR family DNA-binding domain-containing protein [Petroclostridium sp. X23]|uniref:LytR/AlgR family response regulator transcription factor n=1 Tax=Petroclostridium sp. X23 TaxID=3045146 RepID=UPI0024AE462D|nr:LytTR family DNA-binding domain-containing protein [Petroclostridium sp. X23]WHH60089.1 LytTR family DNA-binding domain-containing protein [Petroclostridium sp. X23]